jgi:pSer/pThr/pTyr-binding forkhead associated (FHA) protein
VHLVVPPGGSFRETRKIELGPQALTIGRAVTCDVRLDVPGVDQEHAKISEVALIAVGADCAVGDVPLDPGNRRLVMPGDEIQIGSVVLALEGQDPSLIPPPISAAGENPVLGRTQARGPRIRVVEGANFGDELVLGEEERLYVLGRNPKCDLVLEDREVSREHLKLVRRGYKVFIQDQSSTRGSWLGRAAVYSGSTIEWARPRMLKVGATVLSLELPEEMRHTAAPAVASAGMTPAPRRRNAPPSTPAPPPSVRGDASVPVVDDAAPTNPMPAVDPQIVAAERGQRKAWKKQGVTFGSATGIALLAAVGLAILGALFVVFSLME